MIKTEDIRTVALLVVLVLVTVACKPTIIRETETVLSAAEQLVELELIGSHGSKYIYRFVDREIGAVCWMARDVDGLALSCLLLDQMRGE